MLNKTVTSKLLTRHVLVNFVHFWGYIDQ